MRAALIFLSLLLSATTVGAATTLAELERALQQGGSASLLASQAQKAAAGQLQQATAQAGWQVYGMATPRYGREGEGGASAGVEAGVGLSRQLLGGEEQQQREIANARLRGELAGFAAAESTRAALLQLRLAYVDALYAGQLQQLVQAFLERQESARALLAARRQQGLLLPSDEQTYLAGMAEARLQLQQAASRGQFALQQLRQLSGLAVDEAAPQALRAVVASDDKLAIEGLPLVQQSWRQWQFLQQQPASRWDGVQASIGIGLGQKLDSRGRAYGNSNLLANLGISMPLSLEEYRRGGRASREAELESARLSYEQSRLQWLGNRQQQQAQLSAIRLENRSVQDYLQALQQSLHERQLRAERLPGDTVEQWLAARYRYYRQSLTALNGWQQEQAALARLAALGDGVVASESLPLHDWLAPLTRDLSTSAGRSGISVSTDSQTRPAAAPAKPVASTVTPLVAQARSLSVGSYVWDSRAALRDPAAAVDEWQRYDLDRVLIGLDARQLAAANLVSEMTRLLDLAHRKGIAVELLLGDASWIAPAGRDKLHRLLQGVAQLPMDGLSLDLEIEQLPDWQARQTRLQQDWLATLMMASQTVRWPLAATFHHRHLAMPALGRQLREAGVARADIMLFSTSQDTVRLGVGRALAALDSLPFSLVQSVEKSLSPQESHYRHGLASLQGIAGVLVASGGQRLLIQDWATLRTLSP